MHQRHHIGSVMIFLVVFGICWYLTNSRESLNTGETVNYQHGVQHCVNGKSFIVEDRAHNCSLKTSFNPYTLPGTDVQSLIPSLPESQNTCLPVKFSTPHRMPRTALASHPGSGNGWTRHLIQQLTGVYVGARYNNLMVYTDEKPKHIPFKRFVKWVWNGSCIAIKTHEGGIDKSLGEYDPRRFDKAIILIRNPHDSLMAEYKRQYSGIHGRPKTIQEDIYSPKGNFSTFYNYAVRDWVAFYRTWLSSDVCTLVLQYKQLQQDLHAQLMRIAHFLGIDVHTLKPSHLECILGNTGRGLIRAKVLKPSYPYTAEMDSQLEQYKRQIRDLLRHRHGIADITF